MRLPTGTYTYVEMATPVLPIADHSWNDQGICSVCGERNEPVSRCNHALANGTIRWMERQEATCRAAGHEGHYYCIECGKAMQLGADGHSFVEMTKPVIPVVGHNYENGECTFCGTADPNATPNVPGGDVEEKAPLRTWDWLNINLVGNNKQ